MNESEAVDETNELKERFDALPDRTNFDSTRQQRGRAMAMNLKKPYQQLHVLDPLPQPTTDSGWLDWLRREGKVSIKWGEESDYFKIVIDGETEDADKGGKYQNLELDIDKERWADALLDCIGSEGVKKIVTTAKDFYPFWKERAINKKR